MPVPKTKAALKAELLRLNSAGLFPSMEGDDCLYRGPGGRRCPVGVCIPDYKWRKRYEGERVSSLANVVSIPAGVTYEDLDGLQLAHDRLANPGRRWPKRKFATAVKDILG